MDSDYDAEQSEFTDSGDEELSLGSEGGQQGAVAAELGLDTSAPEFYDPEADERDERWMAKQRRGHTSDAVLSCPLCFTTLCLDCQQHARYEDQFRAMFVMNCRVLTREAVRVPAKPKRSRRRQRPEQQGVQQQATSADAAALASAQKEQQAQQQVQQQVQQGQQQQQQEAPLPLGQPQQQEQQGVLVAGAPGAQQQEGAAAEPGGEVLNPVQCAACGTEVGLRDAEGVYHFFNVFASNA